MYVCRVAGQYLLTSLDSSHMMNRHALVTSVGSTQRSHNYTAYYDKLVCAASIVRYVQGGRGPLCLARTMVAMSSPTPSTCRTPRPEDSVDCKYVHACTCMYRVYSHVQV